jgi:DNA-binding NarL/FixJ family response regulator
MKVLLVDDHPLILMALQALVAGLGDGVEVVAADGGARALQAMWEHPDLGLALLDLRLGDADGFDVLVSMRRDHPQVPVVVVSASESSADVVRALDLGAMGFVPKRASNQELLGALRQVIGGSLFVPQSMFGPNRLAAASEEALGWGPPSQGRGGPASFEALGLTPRQLDVLRCLMRGLPNKLVARELDLALDTVKDHVQSLLRILNVSSRTQAVLAVSRLTQNRPGVFSWRPATPSSTRG